MCAGLLTISPFGPTMDDVVTSFSILKSSAKCAEIYLYQAAACAAPAHVTRALS
jgi:hypothetical protein